MNDQRSLLADATEDELLDLLAADANLPEGDPRRRWPKDLAVIVSIVEDCLKRHRGKSDFAIAAQIAIAQSRYAGGRALYIPQGRRLETALRDAEIYRRAKAGNLDALATEYNLTLSTIYEILREQKALHMAKVQPQLFDEPEGSP